ncbi:RagB/SusD family nutrient uptake outer membrane protein [Danxiaibacter flavus]|uniref:RagB/SusD family nutrient uptake outer membrane protein n=1 Tax=Danxiaibacter flavus TaxID=3049108 RepID=A0ABV3ZAA2_9BACT|nr:RagB/SusD family nutrient uptake outer membrane protein [Chitinophagaceae bacterium DXS]
MKKVNSYIMFLVLSLVIFNSCDKDLNVPPQNILQDDDLYSNESAVTAYFATLYNDLPVEDFNFSKNGFNTWADGGGFLHDLSDESITNQTDNKSSIGDGTWLQYWAYGSVRNVNDFIAKLPTSSFTDDKKKQWMGEARFIRAYYYFGMVKRYGGVPLITVVQNYTGNNLQELQVPRNTEKELYDFVAAELDSAANLLPDAGGQGADQLGKVNKYTALALKSRAMLYAASIAQYGTVQLNGLVGIPSAEAPKYWQAAYDAAKKVIDAGHYSLYNKNPDKTQNFTALFLDASSSENIFIKQFSYPKKTHSYDNWNLPYSVRGTAGYGSRTNPTLELAEQYEYIDGSDGKLQLNDASGNPKQYASPTDLFRNKDPRFGATYIYPFADWKGTTIDIQAGIIDNGQVITSGRFDDLYNGKHIIGANGIGGGGGEVSQTGFYIRKYLNSAYDRSKVAPWTSAQAFIDMRYAEVLLNFAEAAIELHNVTDAKWALNQLRDRAGIALLADNQVTREKVRHERQVELAFESHRYWDIRRWRIADKILNNSKTSALLPYLVLSNNSYIFKTSPVGFPKTFTTNLYYERVDPNEISKNPKLVQNPGY